MKEILKMVAMILVGGLFFAGLAYATTDGNSLSEIETLHYTFGTVAKFYDQNDNVVCYTNDGGPSGYGISCIKL